VSEASRRRIGSSGRSAFRRAVARFRETSEDRRRRPQLHPAVPTEGLESRSGFRQVPHEIVDTAALGHQALQRKVKPHTEVTVSRWQRVLRGMVGIGLTFSAGVGVVGSMLAVLSWLLFGWDPEMARLVVASSVFAFPMGVAVSGVVAITSRGGSFDKLSLPRFAALGAGAGLLLSGVLGVTLFDSWTLVNATILVLLGAGSATASLMLARRGDRALEPGDEAQGLGDGGRQSSEI